MYQIEVKYLKDIELGTIKARISCIECDSGHNCAVFKIKNEQQFETTAKTGFYHATPIGEKNLRMEVNEFILSAKSLIQKRRSAEKFSKENEIIKI